jgi:hypothetical protein
MAAKATVKKSAKAKPKAKKSAAKAKPRVKKSAAKARPKAKKSSAKAKAPARRSSAKAKAPARRSSAKTKSHAARNFLIFLLLIAAAVAAYLILSGRIGGSGGTFTLTDIPEEYNGTYAKLSGDNSELDFETYGGHAEATKGSYTEVILNKTGMKGCLVSDGSVQIPMWSFYAIRSPYKLVPYSGSDTLGIQIYLSTGENWMSGDTVKYISFDSVEFSGGSAARSWDDKN